MALGRIVANVEVTNPVASIQLGSAYGPARVAATVVVPISAVSAIHIVKQVDLDIRGLNPVIFEISVTADTTSLHPKKGITEDVGIADAVFKIFSKKGILDFPTVAEQHSFDLQRSFSDTADVTDDFLGQANPDDDQTMLFSKTLPKEHQYVSDTDNILVGKNVTDTATTSEQLQPFVLGKGLTDAPIASEDLSYTYSKPLADSVGATDDFFGDQNVDDDQTLLVSKTTADQVSNISDSDTLEVGKGLIEDKAAVDTLQPFVLGKRLDDTALISETPLLTFAKAPIEDEIAATEAYASEFVRGTEREQLYHTDGTSFWDNYVDRSYMVSGYAGVFIPQIDFSKPLDEPVTTDDALAIAMLFERNFSDNANVTDDFDGDISSEDDQTMRFAKGLSDLARSSIIVNRDMTKPLSDSSTASEALARLTEKKLSDISSFSDIISTYNVKRLDDVFTTSDGIEKFDIEKLLNDTADATDDFDGVATAEDDQTMSFVTSRTETFSVGDSVSPAAGKNLAESVSTSDSGSLRKTDYCDVLYFADVYVGTSATF